MLFFQFTLKILFIKISFDVIYKKMYLFFSQFLFFQENVQILSYLLIFINYKFEIVCKNGKDEVLEIFLIIIFF